MVRELMSGDEYCNYQFLSLTYIPNSQSKGVLLLYFYQLSKLQLISRVSEVRSLFACSFH